MFAPGVVSVPLVQVPPVELLKLVQVPLRAGDQLPFAGPLVIVQVKLLVPPLVTLVGDADSVQVGTGAALIVTV